MNGIIVSIYSVKIKHSEVKSSSSGSLSVLKFSCMREWKLP